jgi:hypothetical protein
MNKKLLSLVMAVAMIVTLAMPALATGGTRTGDKVEYTPSTKTPSVTVTMPSSPKVILNPYGMSVTVVHATGAEATNETTGITTSSGQILSMTQYITNRTQSAMKVGVKATAVTSGGTILSAKFCTGKEVTKTAFLVAELQYTGTTSGDGILDTGWFTDVTSGDSSINEKCYPQIVPTTAGKLAPAIMSVPAAEIPENATAVAPNYIAVQVFGNLATAPTDAWTDKDTATMNLEFTFTPTVTHKATVSGDAVTVQSTITRTAAASAEAVMGGVIILNVSNGKAPTAKDANNLAVPVVKVSDKLYYLTMPSTDVTITKGT